MKLLFNRRAALQQTPRLILHSRRWPAIRQVALSLNNEPDTERPFHTSPLHTSPLPHALSKKVKCLMRVCEKNLSFATHKAETLRRNLMEESVRKSDHSYGGKNTNKHPLFSVTRATTTAILLSSHHVDIEQRLSFSALKRNSLTHRIKSQF